jgi:hypothetical protein
MARLLMEDEWVAEPGSPRVSMIGFYHWRADHPDGFLVLDL